MAYKRGDRVQTKRFCVTTDSNRIGYPETAIPQGSIGTICTNDGPMPFVSRPGTFYKVDIGKECVAIRTDNLKRA